MILQTCELNLQLIFKKNKILFMTNAIDSKPNNLSPKRIRLGVFAFYFSQGICFSSWASRIPDIKNFLKLGDASWGTILLMLPVGQILGMTLSGFLISKMGSKKILIASLPCYALSLLLIGCSQTELMLILTLILFGFFGNFCNISVNTQGILVENLYKKSIMSSFHGGWSIAGFTGSLIGLVMVNLGLSPFQHYLFILFTVGVLILFNFKYLQIDAKNISDKNSETKSTKEKQKPEKFLFLLGITAFCGMASEGAMFDWSGIYFEEIVKASKNWAPLGFTSFMIMMASGRFIADHAIQKWGRKRIVQLSGILISLGLFISVAFPNLFITTLSFMIIGLGVSSIIPTIYSLSGQKTKIPTGMALTIVSSIGFIGFLLGPPVIGYISEALNLRFSFALIGIFGICIFILSSNLKVFKD